MDLAEGRELAAPIIIVEFRIGSPSVQEHMTPILEPAESTRTITLVCQALLREDISSSQQACLHTLLCGET